MKTFELRNAVGSGLFFLSALGALAAAGCNSSDFTLDVDYTIVAGDTGLAGEFTPCVGLVDPGTGAQYKRVLCDDSYRVSAAELADQGNKIQVELLMEDVIANWGEAGELPEDTVVWGFVLNGTKLYQASKSTIGDGSSTLTARIEIDAANAVQGPDFLVQAYLFQ